jgi:hypothetical protein
MVGADNDGGTMLRFIIVVLLAAAGAGCATHAMTSGQVVIRDDRGSVELRFGARDRALISDYYRQAAKSKRTPPGLAKREQLPPGLAHGGRLPPGLQSRGLPSDLESRLTTLPTPYVRLVIGRDVVLMKRDTRVVLDVVYGAVPE